MIVYFCMSFAPNFAIFKICYGALGFLACGIGTYTLMMELSKNSWKWVIGGVTTVSWTGGNIWMTTCTYFFRDWRLALQLTALPFLSTLAIPFLVPESPRWLLKNGRKKEAIYWIKRIAARNGVTIDEKHIDSCLEPMLKQQENDNQNHETVWEFLKAKSLVLRFAILCAIK